MKIELQMLLDLCDEYKVEFKVVTVENHYLFYYFGPVVWKKELGCEFNLRDYIDAVKRLSATFPNIVLGNIPNE